MADNAIIEVLPHLTAAIVEYKPLPPNSRIDWLSINVEVIEGEEKIVIIGMIRNPDKRLDGMKIYGVVPTKLVIKEDKRAIIDYFISTHYKRAFESASMTDSTTIH